MPSLTEDPNLTRSVQGARRDSTLARRAYRIARRQGKWGDILNIAQAADKMGIPVGRPTNDAELEGVGQNRYALDLVRSGGRPRPGGLAGFDFRHSSDGGPGVGDYANPDESMPLTESAGVLGAGRTDVGRAGSSGALLLNQGPGLPAENQSASILPPPATSAPQPYASVRNVTPRQGFHAAWMAAPTQEAKDALVERAHVQGVPMNGHEVSALERRGIMQQRQATAVPATVAGVAQPQDMNDPAVSTYGTDPAVNTYLGTPQVAAPRRYETSTAMRARLNSEMALFRKDSADTAASLAKGMADTEAYAQKTFGMSSEQSLDPARVKSYYDARMGEVQGRSQSLDALRRRQNDSALAGELLNMDKGSAETVMARDPRYGTPGVAAALERLRKSKAGDELSAWENIQGTKWLKDRAEDLVFPRHLLRR